MFYRAVSYVLPVTIMRLPYSALEALVWANITYWEINMAPLASRSAPGLLPAQRISRRCCLHATSPILCMPFSRPHLVHAPSLQP